VELGRRRLLQGAVRGRGDELHRALSGALDVRAVDDAPAERVVVDERLRQCPLYGVRGIVDRGRVVQEQHRKRKVGLVQRREADFLARRRRRWPEHNRRRLDHHTHRVPGRCLSLYGAPLSLHAMQPYGVRPWFIYRCPGGHPLERSVARHLRHHKPHLPTQSGVDLRNLLCPCWAPK
jgi:hypothetical protein